MLNIDVKCLVNENTQNNLSHLFLERLQPFKGGISFFFRQFQPLSNGEFLVLKIFDFFPFGILRILVSKLPRILLCSPLSMPSKIYFSRSLSIECAFFMKEMSNLPMRAKKTLSNKLSPQKFFIYLEKSSIGKKRSKKGTGRRNINFLEKDE